MIRATSRLALRLSLGLLLLLAPSPAPAGVTVDDLVVFHNRFGDQSGPTSIGTETYTEVVPGQRFMYSLQTAFESGTSFYSTTVEVEFPDSVIPHVDAYPSEYVQVVGNVVHITRAEGGGVSIRIPFDVKDEGDLPAGATEIRMKTHIAVVTPSDGTLENAVEDVLGLVRESAFTAAASATPAEVQLEDTATTITVTLTLTNIGNDQLTNVEPTADPTPSNGTAVEKSGGPTPASVDLAAGASATITYTYAAKKAGRVTFAFPSFSAQGPSGPVGTGGVSTNEVVIKEDVAIAVTVEPKVLATDSSAASGGIVRLKITNKNGDPVAGQRVALNFPQYVGLVDLNPRLLVCKPDGTRVFPPGENPTLNDAAYGTTPEGGEVAFQLWLGTQRRSSQLLVGAAAVDASNLEVASDGEFVDLPESGQSPTADLSTVLDGLQRSDLPAAQQADTSGVTGTGAPLEVLESLVRWLLAKREAGVDALESFDFVPITSADQSYAGVLIHARNRLQDVIAHFDGGPAVDALVLQIEWKDLLSFTHEVKWQRPLMSLDTWEGVPLNSVGLVENGIDTPARGRAVPVLNLLTDSPYAYLGYPYPAAGAAAAGSYGGGCVPAMTGVGAELHSPVTLLVKNAAGQSLGFDPSGAFVNEIPGAVYSGGEPARYLLPPGSYQADLLGTDKGPATLILSAPGVAAKTITLKVKAGKTGTLTFDDSLAGPSGTFNKRKLKVADGVPITVTGLKKKIKVHSGDTLTLTVKNLFGNGVAGARVHAIGTDVDAETLTAPDGVAAMPLLVTKATKRLSVTIDGAGVQAKTLKVKVKLLK
jgi:hypothetical protein